MPLSTALVVVVVTAIFTAFAGVLAWAQFQTPIAARSEADGPQKKRAF